MSPLAKLGRMSRRVSWIALLMLSLPPVMAKRYSQPEIRAMFVFAPLPRSTYKLASLKVSGSGLFRLFVDEQGKVTSVSVLKSIGHPQIDVAMVKTFYYWRARPGPKREVDIPVAWMLPEYR